MVNGILMESLLYHVYMSNPTSVSDIHGVILYFEDHILIGLDYASTKQYPVTWTRINWTKYTRDGLCALLSVINWNISDDSVQCYLNYYENKLKDEVDKIVPLTDS